jgi:hypothetical protein
LRCGGLDRSRVERVRDGFGKGRAGVGHLLCVGVGEVFRCLAVLQIEQPELSWRVLHTVTTVYGLLADELLLDELNRVRLLLCGAAVKRPHVRIAADVKVSRLVWRTADAHHLACGEFVGESTGKRRAAEHDERLDTASSRTG